MTRTSSLADPWRTADFADWLDQLEDRSPNTIKAYQGDVSCLQAFLGPSCRPESVSPADLQAFANAELRRGCSAITVRRRIQGIRSYFRWLEQEGRLRSNPAQEVRGPAVRSRYLPRALTLREIELLLEVPGSTSTHQEVRLAIAMAVTTGLRVSELCGINTDDVDATSGRISVIGKGRRQRLVFVTDKHVLAELRHRCVERSRRPLLLDANRTRLTPDQIRRRLKTMSEIADFTPT